jgi:hypothetical protein
MEPNEEVQEAVETQDTVPEAPAPDSAPKEVSFLDFVEKLPEDLREQAKRYPSLEDAIKHNLSLRKKVSNALVPPEEGAPEEEVQEFRQKLSTLMGVPKTVDEYSLDSIDTSGMSEDDISDLNEFKEMMFKNMAPKEAVTGAAEWFAKTAQAKQKLISESREKTLHEIKQKYGKDFDRVAKYTDEWIQQKASPAVKELFGTVMVDGKPLGDHPIMIDTIMNWAAAGMEHGEQVRATGQDLESATQQYEDLTSKIVDAKMKGDFTEVKRLNRQREEVSKRLGP